MKIIKLLCLSTLILVSCSHANKAHSDKKSGAKNEMGMESSTITKVQMNSNTRGTQISVEVTPKLFKMVRMGMNPKEEIKELTSTEWKEFTSLFSNELLKDLPNLEIKDKSFMSDASMATTLMVYEGDKEIKSPVYSNSNPPMELKKIMDTINKWSM